MDDRQLRRLAGGLGIALAAFGALPALSPRRFARLEAENKALQEKVAYLSTEAYVETAARDKLNFVRPADRALVVVPAQVDVAWVEPPPAADAYRLPPEFGHTADWLALFFGPR